MKVYHFLLIGFGRVGGGFDFLQFLIDERDLFFLFLEIAIGVQQIIYGRNEKGMVVATSQIAGKGCEIADFSLGSANNQYAEHFALLELFLPFWTGL